MFFPRLLVKWLVLALSILVLPHVFMGVGVDGIGAALAAAAVLSVLNAVVKPLLVFITLPFTVISLGLFLFVINALLLKWTSYWVAGFAVDSFATAFMASLVVSFISWIMNISSFSPQTGVRFMKIERRPTRDASTIDLDKDGQKWK
ncbi:MAG: phage holin family protein [Deltaproteobacteria bacterium]|nr:phage holin family protein [Deltaproteobacteria bacterium]